MERAGTVITGNLSCQARKGQQHCGSLTQVARGHRAYTKDTCLRCPNNQETCLSVRSTKGIPENQTVERLKTDAGSACAGRSAARGRTDLAAAAAPSAGVRRRRLARAPAAVSGGKFSVRERGLGDPEHLDGGRAAEGPGSRFEKLGAASSATTGGGGPDGFDTEAGFGCSSSESRSTTR